MLELKLILVSCNSLLIHRKGEGLEGVFDVGSLITIMVFVIFGYILSSEDEVLIDVCL